MLVFASGRGNHVFSVSTPQAWISQWQLPHGTSGINKIALLYRFYQSDDGNPVVSWTGGGTNRTVIAQVCALRGVDQVTPFDVLGATSSNVSQVNIGPISGITTGPNGKCVIVFGHRADDWTSVATLTGDGLTWNEIGEPSTTSGNDAGEVWDYAISATGSIIITAKTFTVTGGLANTGLGVIQSLNEAIVDVFGNPNIEAAQNLWNADIDFCKFQFTGPTGIYTGSIGVYLHSVASSPNNKMLVGIYKVTDNSKVVGSVEKTGLVVGWQTQTLGSFTLENLASYWLVIHAPTGNSGRYTVRAVIQHGWQIRAYDGTLPDTLSPAGQNEYLCSIYCTYTSIISERIVGKEFPMYYYSQGSPSELRSRVSGAPITVVAQDYPRLLVKQGKAQELKSRW